MTTLDLRVLRAFLAVNPMQLPWEHDRMRDVNDWQQERNEWLGVIDGLLAAEPQPRRDDRADRTTGSDA